MSRRRRNRNRALRRIETERATEREDMDRQLYLDDEIGGARKGALHVSHFRDAKTDHFKRCSHYPEKLVAEIAGVRVFGAQRDKLKERLDGGFLLPEKTLILNCTGNPLDPPRPPIIKKSPWNLDRHALCVEEIVIAWPDFKVAPLAPSFWPAVWRIATRNSFKNLVACCVGSHGRTGTALACLLVAKGYDPELAISTVRRAHCHEAIETREQERYVRQIAEALGRRRRKSA